MNRRLRLSETVKPSVSGHVTLSPSRKRHEGCESMKSTILASVALILSAIPLSAGEKKPDGGVVIAMEIPSGAAVAGPFDIAQPRLDGMITRILAAARGPKPVVH